MLQYARTPLPWPDKDGAFVGRPVPQVWQMLQSLPLSCPVQHCCAASGDDEVLGVARSRRNEQHRCKKYRRVKHDPHTCWVPTLQHHCRAWSADKCWVCVSGKLKVDCTRRSLADYAFWVRLHLRVGLRHRSPVILTSQQRFALIWNINIANACSGARPVVSLSYK